MPEEDRASFEHGNEREGLVTRTEASRPRERLLENLEIGRIDVLEQIRHQRFDLLHRPQLRPQAVPAERPTGSIVQHEIHDLG